MKRKTNKKQNKKIVVVQSGGILPFLLPALGGIGAMFGKGKMCPAVHPRPAWCYE